MIEVRGSGQSFAVYQDGKQLTRPYWNKETALKALDRLEKARTARKRRCMTCGTVFKSEGPHNRLCTSCRRLGADL